MLWGSGEEIVVTIMIGGRKFECSEKKKIPGAAVWNLHIRHPTVILQSCPHGVIPFLGDYWFQKASQPSCHILHSAVQGLLHMYV
jgi:hypothetical protein